MTTKSYAITIQFNHEAGGIHYGAYDVAAEDQPTAEQEALRQASHYADPEEWVRVYEVKEPTPA